MIKIERLNKKYGVLHVLKDIDLEIEKGEIAVIIGPSGKSWQWIYWKVWV